MNPARATILQMTRQYQAETRLMSRRPSSVFIPPKTREVISLVDWIADHPDAKKSRSLRKIQDAYLESLGIL